MVIMMVVVGKGKGKGKGKEGLHYQALSAEEEELEFSCSGQIDGR